MEDALYKRNLIISVCLHIFLILIIGLGSLFARSSAEEIQLPGPVFEMIEVDLAPGVPQPAAAAEEVAQEQPAAEEIAPPEPEPEPEPEPVIVPKQEKPKPREVEKKPEPKRETAEERMRRLRENAKAVNTPKPAPPKPKSGPAIKIDASDVARNLSRIPTQPGPPGGGGGGGSADSYKAKVIQVLWRLWKPPVQKANEGIPVIHFTISANGVITGARLTQSSGDPGLDRSVTDIFTQTVQVPAPPGGRPMELTVNFIRDY